jgi:hypothetical protein
MPIKPSTLRAKPIEILDRDLIPAIEPPKRVSKMAKLKKRPGLLTGDNDDIFSVDWLKEWREEWGVTK